MEEKREIIYSDISSASRKQPYDAMVYLEGDQIIAINRDGKIIAKEVAGEDDTRVIMAAITEHITGGHIHVRAGEYVLRSEIAIQNGTNITLTGDNNTVLIRDRAGLPGEGSSRFWIYMCDGITIRNIQFTRTNELSATMGIHVDGSKNVTISECALRDFISTIAISGRRDRNTRSSNVLVENCKISRYSSSGIILGNGSDHVTIRGCEIYDGYQRTPEQTLLYGIATATLIKDPEMSGYNHLVIENNYLHDQPLHHCIDIHGGNDIYVTNNVIERIAGHGIYIHNIAINQLNVNNGEATVDDIPLPGTPHINNHNWQICGNSVTDVGNAGIVVNAEYTGSTVDGVVIHGNYIYRFRNRGIDIGGSSFGDTVIRDVVISNNIIPMNDGIYKYSSGIRVLGPFSGISQYAPPDVNLATTPKNIVITGNIIGMDTSEISGHHPIEIGILISTIAAGCNITISQNSIELSQNSIEHVLSKGIFICGKVPPGRTTEGMDGGIVTVHGNVLQNCEHGLSVEVTPITTTQDISDNICIDCEYGLYMGESGNLDGTSLNLAHTTCSRNNLIRCTHKIRAFSYITVAEGNIGFSTKTSGVATIASDAVTSGVIPHMIGASATDAIYHIVPARVVAFPTEGNLGNATKFWVSDISGVNFKINVDQAPGEQITFYWIAEA